MVEVEKRLSRTIIPGPIFPVICQIGTCHLSNDVTCVVCIYRLDADSGARMMSTKRGSNWTEREKVVLVEEVVKREAVLFGKFHGTSVTSETKQTAWEAVAAGVNAIAQVPKTVDQVKKQYSNIKQRAKETVDSLRKTGGGPRQEATQSQALLLENIGSRPEVIGLPVNLDTEDTNYSEETCVLKPACPESPVPGSSKSMVSQNDKDKRLKRKRQSCSNMKELESTNIELENMKIKEETKKIKLEQEKLQLEIDVLKLKKIYYAQQVNQLPACLYEV
ncbi:myb/SANT-like DNA-binding domain-containing protein 4 [Argopecten irradians]|uniref:myb/SANT-like DNA-binding domain-containing protein 4 n=1 Tax=Argopecten irradians TaxID=31199 RepID=UPI003710C559